MAALSNDGDPPPQAHVDEAIGAFFARNGFHNSAREACDRFARLHFPNISLKPAAHQGYCSYTVAVSGSHLLQFRPKPFRLDLQICDQAKAVFPELVPSTRYIGVVDAKLLHSDETEFLDVYLQERCRGVTLRQFRSLTRKEDIGEIQRRRRRLVKGLARFFSTSYLHRRYPKAPGVSFKKGRVGNTLRQRLDMLESLPSRDGFRCVDKIHQRLGFLESDAAWCLTHGDLVPDNIMVDPVTGHLTGLIDWAEGEWLPFGTGLYGLEEVLGEQQPGGAEFEYYPEHLELRLLFWRVFLQTSQPQQAIFSRSWLADLELCRKLGFLLWRGIAFDDGKLDRVVDAEKDGLELHKLELFLGTPEPMDGMGWRWRLQLFYSCFGVRLGNCLRRIPGAHAAEDNPPRHRSLDSIRIETSGRSKEIGDYWTESATR